MLGTFVNVIAVILGTLVGLVFKKGIPQKISDSVIKAVGICVLFIGLDGCFAGENTLILVISMVIGTIIGSFIDIDSKLNHLGDKINSKFSGDSPVAQGFVTASLVFCVGAMAVVGSLNSGLGLGHETIYTKSLLDFITAMMLTVSLGIGVIFSSVSVLIYQGAIVLLAGFLKPFLTDFAVGEMTCVGSMIILTLGLNLMGISKIKIANLLPAIFIAPIIANIVENFF